jgi:excisionase family DNA binding protein
MAGDDFAFADLTNVNSALWNRALQRFLVEISRNELGHTTETKVDRQKVNHIAPEATISNPVNMSVSEAASYLRVSTNTLYKWTSQGRIPHRKVGTKKLGFSRDELDQFLASGRIADDIEIKERASKAVERLRGR